MTTSPDITASDSNDTNSDPLRAGLQAQWSAAAAGWDEHAEYVDERARPVTERMLTCADLSRSDRVLELACGPGGLGLAAATRVDGDVVLSDVAPAMTAIAARRAAALGLRNVQTREFDLEQIAEPDAAFDVVLCRDGLMLVPEPAAAVAEIARVLRPGGRVVVTVWGAPDANPWLSAVLDAVGEHVGMQIPPPGIPGPFALSEAGALDGLLRDHGFDAVTIEGVEAPFRCASVEQWLQTVPALAGPVAALLEALPAEMVDAIRVDAAAAVAAYVGGDEIVIPGLALVASGRIGE